MKFNIKAFAISSGLIYGFCSFCQRFVVSGPGVF